MKELTKVEEEIMQIIWQLERCVVRDVLEKLPEPKPPYTTVSSVFRILERKGFLNHKTFGKTYEYFPIISKLEYKKFAVNDLVKKYFGSPKSLLSFFVKEQELSLSEMQQLLNNLENEEE